MALEVGTLWGSQYFSRITCMKPFQFSLWLRRLVVVFHRIAPPPKPYQTKPPGSVRPDILRYRYAFCISNSNCIAFPSFLPLFNFAVVVVAVAFGWMWILPLKKNFLSHSQRAIKKRKKDNFLQGIGFVLCVNTIIISQCVVCDRGDAFYY